MKSTSLARLLLGGGFLLLFSTLLSACVRDGGGEQIDRSKGDEALLEAAGQRRESCVNQPAKSVWEHARLSGVDFRAVGQEPGWYLEIRSGERLVFVGDYGRSRHEFAISERWTDQRKRRTVYSAGNAQRTLTLVLDAQPCRDTMSDEAFETTVTVLLDGLTYRGCGRPLH